MIVLWVQAVLLSLDRLDFFSFLDLIALSIACGWMLGTCSEG